MKKILIVEDETVIAMDLQLSLESFGYNVTGHVTRGEDVIAAFSSGIPDLILMDIKLEGVLDGVETAQLVQENYNIPVIFITSYSNSEIIERAKRANPFGYIVKPFSERELATNIEIAIYKHETELKLKESERKYRELSESIQQIIIECDLSGTITYVNQAGLELLGLTYSEYTSGVSFTEFISQDSFGAIKRRIDHHSVKETYNLNREYLLTSKFGKHYFIEEYLSPVFENAAVTGFRGILIDITSKRLKERLHTLYSKLTHIFNKDSTEPIEVIQYLLVEFKRHFFYLEDVYFNELVPDKLMLRTYKNGSVSVREFNQGHSEFTVSSNVPLYLRGKELFEFNKKNNIKIFGSRAASWTGFPLQYQKKDFGVFVFQSYRNENALTLSDFENLSVFFNNINYLFESISYLKQIRQSEEKYKHLVNSINEGLIQSDLKGNVTFINKQLTDITGYTEEDIIGKNLIESLIANPGAKSTLKEELGKRKEGFSSQYELNILSKSGVRKDLVINGSSFRNSRGKIIGTIATIVDITEKREYLKLIKESEQKFKTIFQQAAVGVAIVDSVNGRLLDVNKKYCEIFGYKKKELKQMNFSDFTYPSDLDADLEQMDLLKQGKVREFTLEKRHIKKNGEIVWVNLTVSPLWEVGEEPTHHIAILENITRRKKMEEDIITSENEKENILKSMPDSFIVFERVGTIISSYLKNNLSFIKPAFGKNINGAKIKDTLANGVRDFVEQNIKSCVAKKETIIEQVEIKTGKKISWFETRLVAVNEEVLLLIIRDVSEIRKKSDDIHKFFNVIEQTKELIMITDKSGKIEYINPKFSEVTGYNISEVRGKNPAIFRSNKHTKGFFAELWQTILSGKSYQAEIMNKKKNGEIYIEQKIITPLIDASGEIINFISTGRDITAEKKREKKIKIYEKFEKTLEKKEQKYRTLSLVQGQENERKRIAREIHDGLGQMLTVASSNLNSIVLKKSESKETIAKFKVISEMISEIIQESRRISHNLSPVGLYEFGLNAVVSQFVKRINTNGSGVRVILQSNIENLRFKTESEINLYRIIQETIQNSLKHSQCTVIRININYNDGVLKLSIKDNGIGFSLSSTGNGSRHHNGLQNIQERAKIIDSKVRIVTAPGKGFEIHMELKLKNTIKND